MCWQKNWIGSKKFQVFVKRTKSDRACRKIHLYALFFYVFSRKKSKSRKKGEKSEDKDKIALQIKQVKKGRVTVEEAAEDANMTVEQFKKVMENASLQAV